MAYNKRPSLGQATMANSEPIVIASDQSAIPVTATDLDIRNLTNTDVVTAELSAVDNAVLDTIAAKDFATQTTLSALDTKIATLTKLEDSASASGDAGIPLLAVRQLTDTTSTDADGDYTLLKLDEEGRLKTSAKTASFAVCSGVLTTTAASASSTIGDVATAAGFLSVNVSRASNVVLHVKNTGGTNQTAGNFTFEASIDSTNGTDGTWFGIQVARSNANTIELTTGTLTLNAGVGLGYSYESSVNAYNWLRVRVNVNVTTGAADTWTIIRGSYATEPIPAIQTHAVTVSSGTVTTVTNITNQGHIADNAAFTDATTRVMMAGYVLDEVAGTALTENDGAAARIDSKRAIVNVLEDATTRGQRLTVTSRGSLYEEGAIAHDAVDAGNPIKVGGRASSSPVTAVATNDRVDSFFDLQGRQIVSTKAQTATLTNVASSATSVTVLAANAARLGVTIWNDSTAILYLKFGATASTTSCTVKLIADAYYEVPFGYYGIIDGIWASANGNARVTEIT